MAYDLRILAVDVETELDDLVARVGAAITAAGSWEEFFEVRMGCRAYRAHYARRQ